MESHTILMELFLILISAKICGGIATYFKAPAVIGELIAGILLGPSLFGFIEMTPPLHLLAQLGVILLLFEVGIDTDIGRVLSSGIKALLVAILGVVLPFALGFSVSHNLFNYSLISSLFVGSTLTATSIGITLRVLRDLKKQDSPEAQIILGAAILDDIIGIILLAMLYEFSVSGSIAFLNVSQALFSIVLFFFISPVAAKFFSQIIKKWDEKASIPGLLPVLTLSLILCFAWSAHVLGAPELLGGFTAGLAFSKKFVFPFATYLPQTPAFNHRMEEKIKPIIHLVTPIFFVAIGLSLNLKAINWGSTFIWLLTGSLLIVAILGKILSGIFLRKESLRKKLVVGIAMIPRGEVGLIFANIGLTAGVLQNDVYASIILVIVLTTLLAPFALKHLYTRA